MAFGRRHNNKQPKFCKSCGAGPFVWGQLGGRWVLCPPVPGDADLSPDLSQPHRCDLKVEPHRPEPMPNPFGPQPVTLTPGVDRHLVCAECCIEVYMQGAVYDRLGPPICTCGNFLIDGQWTPPVKLAKGAPA